MTLTEARESGRTFGDFCRMFESGSYLKGNKICHQNGKPFSETEKQEFLEWFKEQK
jgi:hypothetical protein